VRLTEIDQKSKTMIDIKNLRRLFAAFLVALMCAASAIAQEAEGDDASTTEDTAEETAESAASTSGDADVDEEQVDVDDGSYLDAEDDDFRPSEEVSADRSITFPTDI
jgi:hypothetical protein